MNIFWLDEDPVQSAKWHCDKHVSKMIVEYGQILSTAADIKNFHDASCMYEPVHNHNPDVHEWAAESADNYIRLLKMARALADEYNERYGGTHKTYREVLSKIDIGSITLEHRGFTEPPLCMPDEYKVEGDYVKSYRNYYNHGKRWEMSWFGREKPEWYIGGVKQLHD